MTGRPILAIDTSGTRAVVALGSPDGGLVDERRWVAGYRHGEELLSRVDELLAANHTTVAELSGIVVGTGPGAFTGMRVGIATAKALAHGLGLPIAGVATSEALLSGVAGEGRAAGEAGAAGEPGAARAPKAAVASGPDSPASTGTAVASGAQAVLLLPAGPSDRVLVAGGAATLVKGGEEPDIPEGAVVVAVDLPGRAPEEALALGQRAEEGLSAALLSLGARRLAAGGDDVALLVPEYVTLPRGIGAVKGEVRWSRDRS
jgi:tRNA threonylcarbamoyl adenosine modification protein YeaZ